MWVVAPLVILAGIEREFAAYAMRSGNSHVKACSFIKIVGEQVPTTEHFVWQLPAHTLRQVRFFSTVGPPASRQAGMPPVSCAILLMPKSFNAFAESAERGLPLQNRT